MPGSGVVVGLACTALIVTSLASTPIRPLAAATPRTIGPCVAGWQELPVPDGGFRAAPLEVITHRGRLAWILGGSDDGVLAMRWDGERLVDETVGPASRRGFAGGDAVSRRKVLGVGYLRPRARVIEPLAGHVVPGPAWRPHRAGRPPGSSSGLTDVVRLPGGTSWAVGVRLAAGRSKALAMRRAGGRWRRVDPPGGRDSGLLAVTRGGEGAVWAVGWRQGSGPTRRPWILRRAGTGWRTSRAAAVAKGSAILTDVAWREGHGTWAVGYVQRRGRSTLKPILQRRVAGRWVRASLPWAADVSVLPLALAIGTDGRLWIAGTQLSGGSREARGFIAHGRRQDWTTRVLDGPDGVGSELLSIAATSDGAVAAGRVGATSIVLRTCEAPSAAASRRRIRVSAKRKRARTRERLPAEHATTSIPTLEGLGPSRRLRSPVAPADFSVRDVAAEVGLAIGSRTFSAMTADLDADGWDDVVISRHTHRAVPLLLGGPDGFEPAPADAFSVIDRHDCDAADVDADGRLDLFCATGRSRGTGIGRHELSLEPAFPGGRLVRDGAGVSEPLGRGRYVTFLRLDDDPYPELFITNQPEREDSLPGPNRFFRNDGGRFVPAPGVRLDRPTGGACAVAADLDGDGDDDLLHCQTQPADGRSPGLRIYRNDGGRLRERSAAFGIDSIGDVDVALADVDGDGLDDLVQLGRRTLRVSRRTASGFRRIYQAKLTKAVAVAAGDVDGDGRADIYVVRGGHPGNEPDRLLVNRRRGRAFTSVEIPQATEGSGGDVVALDHDRNGTTDFLVLNGGRAGPGPVQLLATYPASPPP